MAPSVVANGRFKLSVEGFSAISEFEHETLSMTLISVLTGSEIVGEGGARLLFARINFLYTHINGPYNS